MTAMSIRQRTKARSPSSSLNRSWSDDRLDGHVTVTIEEPLSFKSYVPPVPRGPVFIPDKQYQRRVLGRPSRKAPPFSIRSKACANLCAGFSVVAFLFLSFISFLMETQPLYIKGIKPTERNTNRADRVDYGLSWKVSQSASRAAIAYVLTALLCVVLAHNLVGRVRSRIRQRDYHDIPDTGHELPTFVATAEDSVVATASPCWSRVVYNLKRCCRRRRKTRRKKRKGG